MTLDNCKREFAENLGIGIDEMVMLPKITWTRNGASNPVPGLEGTVTEEISDTRM